MKLTDPPFYGFGPIALRWNSLRALHLDWRVAIAMDPFLPTAMMDWHHLACIARKAWTMEAVTIVGSREVKHVELGGGQNIEGLSMIGWLCHLSRPDANLAQFDN